MNMKTLIIYHKDDNDGVFSAAIAKLALGYTAAYFSSEEPTTVGLDYNMANTLAAGGSVLNGFTLESVTQTYDTLVMVDFSFPVEWMKRWAGHYGINFIWCDHHAPIIAATRDAGLTIEGIQDSGHSAMYNAWKYFIQTDVPELIDVLQKYDSWTFAEDERDLCFTVNAAVNAQYGIRIETAYEVVEDLFLRNGANVPSISTLYSTGRVVLAEERRKDAIMIETKGDFTATVDGRPAVMVVHGYNTGSMTFESVKRLRPETVHAVALKRNSNGTWTISLYNIYDDETFHCGDYCRARYNGGGHKGAAGGQIDEETAFALIRSRKF